MQSEKKASKEQIKESCLDDDIMAHEDQNRAREITS